MDKGAFLKAFGADIFFDDQPKHCESARQHVATGHVPHGVANEVRQLHVLSIAGENQDRERVAKTGYLSRMAFETQIRRL